MTDRFSVYVLAEDKRHQSFVRRFLKRAGVGPRQMFFAPIPEGRGSGKQRVLDQFAGQVRLCRRRNSRASTSLIAIMDADQLSLDQCLRQLGERLSKRGEDRIDAGRDRVTRAIPKWSIETWISFLVADENHRSSVTEEGSLKRQRQEQEWENLTPGAAEIFFEWHVSPAKRPARILDSIARGLQEFSAALRD